MEMAIFKDDSLLSLDMSLHVAELQHRHIAACLRDQTRVLSMSQKLSENNRESNH